MVDPVCRVQPRTEEPQPKSPSYLEVLERGCADWGGMRCGLLQKGRTYRPGREGHVAS